MSVVKGMVQLPLDSDETTSGPYVELGPPPSEVERTSRTRK